MRGRGERRGGEERMERREGGKGMKRKNGGKDGREEEDVENVFGRVT